MKQPFYFFMVFWGTHRDYFLNLSLASLLAPGNLPALDRPAKFLIYTPEEDWRFVEAHPLFQRMKAYVEPVWIPLEPQAGSKINVMSRGHKLMAERAFQDKALGAILTPDMIVADGMIKRLQELADEGRKVVLTLAMRYSYEGFASVLPFDGSPIVLSPRQLATLAVKHLHSESIHYDVDSPWFGRLIPVCPFWRVAADGILLHGFSWAPVLLDYAQLQRHDTHTLDHWTSDGDYVYRNFPDPSDIHVVTDSDEIMLVGLTREADLHFEFGPSEGRPDLSDADRARIIARLKFSPIIDPLKQELFHMPVQMHGSDLTKAWAPIEQRAARIVADTSTPPPDSERIVELPRMLETIGPFNIVRHCDVFYVVPKWIGTCNLENPEDRARRDVHPFSSLDDARRAVALATLTAGRLLAVTQGQSHPAGP